MFYGQIGVKYAFILSFKRSIATVFVKFMPEYSLHKVLLSMCVLYMLLHCFYKRSVAKVCAVYTFMLYLH